MTGNNRDGERDEAMFQEENGHVPREDSTDEKAMTTTAEESSSPDLQEYYWKLRDFIGMVAEGETDALMLNAPPGIGKSYQIVNELDDRVGEEGFTKLSGYSTPVELYHALYEVSDGKVLFLDDIEGLLKNKNAVALLKQATWSEGEARYVEWRSTSGKIRVPEKFRFKGRIIMCFNEVPKNDDIFESLMDRCLYYEIDFTHQERLEIIEEVAKLEYKNLTHDERKEVVDWIDTHTGPADEVNLRMMFHMFDLRSYNPEKWELLAVELLGADEELMLVRELVTEYDTVKGAQEAYKEETRKAGERFLAMYDKLDHDDKL